jgi:hypothetical protein
MAARFRPFTKLLRTPIRLDEANQGWMIAPFGLGQDPDVLRAHVDKEADKRFVEFDRFFGLRSRNANIWEMRAKALIAREFGVDVAEKRWWENLTRRLAVRFVPGFTIKMIGDKRRGRPAIRSDTHFAQLFADVESYRRNTGWPKGKTFKHLRTKRGYKRRWRRFNAEKLRKDYEEAKKRRANPRFEFFLCGPSALLAADRDRITGAIEKHALKI